MPLVALITILLLVIAGGYIAYIMYHGLTDSTSTDVTQFVPGMPQDVPRGVAVEAPPEVYDGFNEFVGILEKDNKAPCIQAFDWEKLQGFQIEMLIDDTKTLFLLRNKDGQLVTSTPVKGKQMCVVAGEINGEPIAKDTRGTVLGRIDTKQFPDYKNAAYVFYKNWIEPEKKQTGGFGSRLGDADERLPLRQGAVVNTKKYSPDYSVPEKIVITSADSMDIRFKDGTEMSPDKEDGGLLYVPEEGKVCLVATKRDAGGGCDIEDGLLEQDCFDQKEDGLLSSKDKVYEMKTC